jgi:hypothetical protein
MSRTKISDILCLISFVFSICLDKIIILLIIIIYQIDPKYADESEYSLNRQYREQELVRACVHESEEWVSELQGERLDAQ